METKQPFATVAELEAYWRLLDDSEQTRASVLLNVASARLRTIAVDSQIDLDGRCDEDSDYKQVVAWVVMEATKRALNTPTDVPPVDTYSQTAGPYSENYKFTNPSGDLWFRKAELQAIGLYGNQLATTITPITRGEIYGEQSI